MQLAILVVLMVEPEREALVRLFLDRIRRHTQLPFQIYASINHLSADQRRRLAKGPNIAAIDCPVGKVERGREEHAALLQVLREAAVADGATHFVTMHLDSFPIVDGWAEKIVARLETGDRFATIVPQGYSACLFWDRELEETTRLPFLLSKETRSSEEFRQFQREFPNFDHVETGLGFIYEAWRGDWPWHRLPPTAFQIYGDSFFHLVGGARLVVKGEGKISGSLIVSALQSVSRPIAQRLPLAIRRQIREVFVDSNARLRDGTREQKRAELDALLRDPEAYLSICRRVRPQEAQFQPVASAHSGAAITEFSTSKASV